MITFKAFLSHKYEAADVNLYFFKLFKEVAEVQFEVDKKFKDGENKAAKPPGLSVTRLERMLRDADAFIGLYPFTASPEIGASAEELKKQSRYFRLEIDLAIRSQKPAIIFYDKRYGNLLLPPESVFAHSFDAAEINSKGGSPNMEKFRHAFANFCALVEKKKSYDDFQLERERNTVALFLSEANNIALTEKIESKLEEYNCNEVEVIKGSLNNKQQRCVEKIDFAIVDHGGEVGQSGVAAFLHGRFIPMIRMEKINGDVSAPNPLNNFLYGGFEAGYKKDKIDWDNEDDFFTALTERLDTILKKEVERFNTFDEAEKYFLGAVQREEKIFVSYSGKDLDAAKEIIKQLGVYFKTVFDYRDGESLEPGKPWMPGIFDKLVKSPIGINLLSTSYFASQNCLHEAQQMVAQQDSGNMRLFPVKLYSDEKLDIPSFLQMTQYLRREDFPDAEELVKRIVRLSTAQPV